MAMMKEAVADLPSNNGTKNISRAQRFSIQVPLRYRVGGESVWWKGMTQNISSSGLLFEGERRLESNIAIEMNLILPAVTSEGGGEIICHGAIVRTLLPEDGDQPAALAAKILRYRLARP